MSEASAERIPALIVSGFLGSGKTTLVRHLLDEAQRSGERVAVISNEFGELGIDQALLGEGDETFVELDWRLRLLSAHRRARRDDRSMLREQRARPTSVIIETSGIALPYDTQLNFYREPVASWIGDHVATVVVERRAAARGPRAGGHLRGPGDLGRACSLLNKIDLLRGREAARRRGAHGCARFEPEAPDRFAQCTAPSIPTCCSLHPDLERR